MLIDRNLRLVNCIDEYGLVICELVVRWRVTSLGKRAGRRDPHNFRNALSCFLGQ